MEYLLLYKFMECCIGISVSTFFDSYGHATLFIPFSLTVSNEEQQQEGNISLWCCKVYMTTAENWPELVQNCLESSVVTLEQ